MTSSKLPSTGHYAPSVLNTLPRDVGDTFRTAKAAPAPAPTQAPHPQAKAPMMFNIESQFDTHDPGALVAGAHQGGFDTHDPGALVSSGSQFPHHPKADEKVRLAWANSPSKFTELNARILEGPHIGQTV